MKAEVKSFGRGGKSPDARVRTGRLLLIAEDELDAVYLAMIYRVFFGIWSKPDGRRNVCRALAAAVEHPADFAGFIDLPADKVESVSEALTLLEEE